jgi:hypothetical protein
MLGALARFAAPAVIPLLAAISLGAAPAVAQPAPPNCLRELSADVVALEQAVQFNRYGAHYPAFMIYALRDDVVSSDGGTALAAGRVKLREDKRPRPLVLRMNVGDCLTVNFTNLLSPTRPDDGGADDNPATRAAGFHVNGLHYTRSIQDDGAFVGRNNTSLVPPGGSTSYRLYAIEEGTFLFYNPAVTTGGEGNLGSFAFGLFGAVNVEPRQAEYYRSQVTRAELDMATERGPGGAPVLLPTGHPKIDYNAVYPAGHRQAGKPILAMLQGNRIVHGDVNAIITGPNHQAWPLGTYRRNPVLEPNLITEQGEDAGTRGREEPFREFTILFHDEVKVIQAFPQFEDPVLGHTLHGIKDGFGVNYGITGTGAQVLANRLGLGPTATCAECKYEEFFLSSWAGGDPALAVDVPANTGYRADGTIDHDAPRATRALYPDDPSNVVFSYLNDRTRFRNLHAGAEAHIFHLHAHQWLSNPENQGSSYLDSQFIGPGVGRTYEIAYNGAGNRNQTAGDSIFHCHFYPHFAQGMWGMWRVLDTFEWGTPLDAEGRAAPLSRAYPDGEIAQGTAIPAVVPLPTMALAPLPAPVHVEQGQVVLASSGTSAEDNPGYPFFVPGQAGRRPPRPPLDTLHDGGLPRHVVREGVAVAQLDRLDLDKKTEELSVRWLSEQGEPVERAAMAFHERRVVPSLTPEGTQRAFVTNGKAPTRGAPFADPCRGDTDEYVRFPERRYKSAAFQLRSTQNRAGWHFPQTRMTALWEDVIPTIEGSRAPEPLVVRVNSGDCVIYEHTNLVPHVYQLDDFQVRTPTDVIGQHIHLVKFDVIASDGSANGWNYEDGTLSPGEVQERIHAIRLRNHCQEGQTGPDCPVALPHPFFGAGPNDSWLGAMTTVQRWLADGVLDEAGNDRTLRTVFTHDHFGPSTHQQHGLYSAVAIEPQGATFFHPETGQPFDYSRQDGGPTGWAANVHVPASGGQPDLSFREFVLQLADFAGAYAAGGGVDSQGNPIPDPARAINPPGRQQIGLPYLQRRPQECPGGVAPPCPEAISAEDPGTFLVNYRNEPLALRLLDPNKLRTDGTGRGAQASGQAGDPAYAFRSDVVRAMAQLNRQPTDVPPLSAGVLPGDPFTPLLRTYKNDRVQIRLLAGAHEEPHIASVDGLRWLFNPDDVTSGWRSAQQLGISEHFEFEAPIIAPEGDMGQATDYLYSPSAAAEGLWNGAWGLIRSYEYQQATLRPLPNNPLPTTRNVTLPDGRTIRAGATGRVTNLNEFNGVCPVTANVRRYAVSAVAASTALAERAITYNPRTGAYAGQRGPITDPTGVLYVNDSDLSGSRLIAGRPVEPLVLRANAGDCIEVTLTNRLPSTWAADVVAPANQGYYGLPMLVDNFNANQLRPSMDVGLHAQLVSADATRSSGSNIGTNATTRSGMASTSQTVAPGQKVTYRWYAGVLKIESDNRMTATPVEFGAVNLLPADRLRQGGKGLIGALVVLPQGAVWTTDATTRTAATVTYTGPDGQQRSFRDFVLAFQDDLNLQASRRPICPRGEEPEGVGDDDDEEGTNTTPAVCKGVSDAQDAGNYALNYRTEPFWFRMGYAPEDGPDAANELDLQAVLSNGRVGGDPRTPIFTAKAGQEVRFRLVQPSGHSSTSVFTLHGHSWLLRPYVAGPNNFPSQRIDGTLAVTPAAAVPVVGANDGIGPSNHFDVVVPQAGGPFRIPGDYLFRNMMPTPFEGGQWGILRVTP